MKIIKIDHADIILDDLGSGEGKIIIADTSWGYNFSYFWGSMGSPLTEFLCRINADYFSGKLGPHQNGEINAKKSVKLIRKALNDSFYIDYPWYTNMEFQQSLRDGLKELEKNGFANDYHYFDSIKSLLDYKLDYYSIKNSYDRERIKESLKSIFDEPWHYIFYDEHKEIIYLKKLHKKLVKKLKKNKLKTQTIESI